MCYNVVLLILKCSCSVFYKLHPKSLVRVCINVYRRHWKMFFLKTYSEVTFCFFHITFWFLTCIYFSFLIHTYSFFKQKNYIKKISIILYKLSFLPCIFNILEQYFLWINMKQHNILSYRYHMKFKSSTYSNLIINKVSMDDNAKIFNAPRANVTRNYQGMRHISSTDSALKVSDYSK